MSDFSTLDDKRYHPHAQSRSYYVYILANSVSSVLYIGMTNDIARRVHEHKTYAIEGFTDRYNVTKLVHVEEYGRVEEAIAREKQLKKWSRAKKERLISADNPNRDEIEL